MNRIFHPKTEAEFAARDALLQAALRDGEKPYPIADEYPLVLAPDAARFSYCAEAAEFPVGAHANLWPREFHFKDGTRYKVGLVGNVATQASLRGRGAMTELFRELSEEARESGLEALVLWSDLNEFYQKLGFQPTGRELRLQYQTKRLPEAAKAAAATFVAVPMTERANLAEQELIAMLELRPKAGGTLARTTAEFRRQLTIPATTLVIRRQEGVVAAFAIAGKGRDMVGVVHEWGAPSPEVALGGFAQAIKVAGFSEGLLLTAAVTPQAWLRALAEKASEVTEHPMAWFKPLGAPLPAALNETFIWGLDSI